jgi:hypothetical protein
VKFSTYLTDSCNKEICTFFKIDSRRNRVNKGTSALDRAEHDQLGGSNLLSGLLTVGVVQSSYIVMSLRQKSVLRRLSDAELLSVRGDSNRHLLISLGSWANEQ